MTTALIADDEPQLLDELQQLLADAWPDLAIVALARSGTEARRLLDELRPDIAFLDIRMPGIDGLSLAGLAPAGTRLVFVTAHPEHALDAFEHGAVDYLRKPLTPEQFAAGLLLVKFLQERYGIPPERVYAHNWIDYKDARYCEGCELAERARAQAYKPGQGEPIPPSGVVSQPSASGR